MNTPEPTPEHPARYDGFAVHVPAPQPTPSDCRQGGQIAPRGNETAITGYSQVDDFNASSDGLGPNWSNSYSSLGTGSLSIEAIPTDDQPMRWNDSGYPVQISQHISMVSTGKGDIAAYSSLPNSAGESVGARWKAGDPCANCRKPFEAGDVMQAELAPDMGGTFHHTDCDDPTLAKVVGE